MIQYNVNAMLGPSITSCVNSMQPTLLVMMAMIFGTVMIVTFEEGTGKAARRTDVAVSASSCSFNKQFYHHIVPVISFIVLNLRKKIQ